MKLRHIEIFRGEGFWHARLGDEPEVWEAFGTDVVPIPFAPCVPACEVKARLQKLNPGARIIFLEEVTRL